ncbi:hypothetical protein TraAM80_08413 [Trypanosoma rangeli]|uniref:Uncharacterized protein n=1 Tax=Trypanosoma rangeli TaxID=5698 RepID=A0A3R7KPV8_TRYRA|nr:uncharacterized protein TraAM80_08413 [Trypanosoma rangeli]RNE99024.1 hypothetical protein TraAM80_08413 [Trypanosoma rangeli]|eukprot:RNE99024.1 hypothetical protein TraAM80_08413 [Trypanosoma rangeli]
MESAPSSLSYLRAVQQLQKKTEELERVREETRRLERENAVLLEEKAALMREVTQLGAQNRDWRAEFGLLEEQVRKQQRHLQEHIEREAKRLQTSNAKSCESNAEIMALRQQLEATEVAREEGAAAVEQCRCLSREVAALKRELKASKARASHYHSTHARNAAGSAAMDAIESKALEGLRSEIASFAAENERLMNELEAERKARVVAEEGVVNLQQLLQRQREVSERQQLLSKAELQALNVQNDALLDDVKRLMEQEAMGRNDVTVASFAAANPRRVSTVDRGTVTTEVMYKPLRSPSVQRVRETSPASACPADVSGAPSTTPLQRPIKELLRKVRELESTTAEQALLLREKEANERLLEERAALHAEERRHLRLLLDKATAPERSDTHHDRSHLVRAEADTELSAVLEAIIDLLRLFVHCTARLRARLFLPTANTDSVVLPVVPCRDHNSPQLNAIFSHLGGLRHIAAVIDETAEAALSRQQQQPALRQRESTTATVPQLPHTPVEMSPASHPSTSEARASAPHGATGSAHILSTKRDITSWLTARQENLQRQLQQSKETNNSAQSAPPHSHHNYQSGETLEEAAKEFTKINYRTNHR